MARSAATPAASDLIGPAVMALTARRPPGDIDPGPRGIDTLTRHGLIGAAAIEGGPALRSAALPAAVRLWARQEIMNRHQARIVRALQRAGIPAIVLKGQSVARWYDDPRSRPSTDIDLLVPASAVEDALQELRADDWVTDIPPRGPQADKRHVMIRDESGVSFILDLHWHLFSYHQLRRRADEAMADVWSRVTQDAVLGGTLPLDVEVAFLACHAVLDHRFRLVLFRDLAELAERAGDLGAVEGFATEHGLRALTWTALTAARHFAEAPIDPSFMDRLGPRTLVERFMYPSEQSFFA